MAPSAVKCICIKVLARRRIFGSSVRLLKRIHMRAYLYEYEGYSVSPTAEKPPYYYALSIRKTMMNSLDRLLPKKPNYEGCFAW